MTIKVGDKVRIKVEYSNFYGDIGVVTGLHLGSSLPYTVSFDDGDYKFFEIELELVK